MLRKTTYVVALLAVALVAFLAGTLYHHRRETVTAQSAGVTQRRYYGCPMHPAYKSDRPGTAPCCGMTLEAVQADGAAPIEAVPPGVVTVSAGKQQLVGVQVTTVRRTAGTQRLRLFGRVTPDETRVYKLTAGPSGYIREISQATTGAQVRKDQWLASFYTPEVRQPIGAYLQSLDVLDRERKLAGSPQQVAAAESNTQLAVDRLLPEEGTPLERAMRYLEERIDGRVQVPELAAMVGVSSSHLAALFRDATGGGVLAHHISLKMARARHLLDTTALPVAEVGRQVGMDDPFYFSRQFGRVHGMSPSQYRSTRKG
jgi:AraC-like DNA-binding protein